MELGGEEKGEMVNWTFTERGQRSARDLRRSEFASPTNGIFFAGSPAWRGTRKVRYSRMIRGANKVIREDGENYE